MPESLTERSVNLGVIEGFYGRPWEPRTRLDMMQWLVDLGFDRYLYAPKADAHLRKQWASDWPPEQQKRLTALAQRSADTGLALFLGLSPYRLYEHYDGAARRRLRSRIDTLCDLGIAGLALLFDDMPGEDPHLADKQLEICHDVREWTQGLAMLVCPTYYSDDPVLDDVFGARPADYLATLGAGLAQSIEVFWTGPEVCSSSVSAAQLQPANAAAQRRLALWDNYPVNDSKTRSPHLYMQPLSGRSAELAPLLSSHWCNAMNQAALSIPALASLPALYGRMDPALSNSVFAAAGIDDALLSACAPLERSPLVDLTPAQQVALWKVARDNHGAGRELRDWLNGGYAFDPECLTD